MHDAQRPILFLVLVLRLPSFFPFIFVMLWAQFLLYHLLIGSLFRTFFLFYAVLLVILVHVLFAFNGLAYDLAGTGLSRIWLFCATGLSFEWKLFGYFFFSLWQRHNLFKTGIRYQIMVSLKSMLKFSWLDNHGGISWAFMIMKLFLNPCIQFSKRY